MFKEFTLVHAEPFQDSVAGASGVGLADPKIKPAVVVPAPAPPYRTSLIVGRLTHQLPLYSSDCPAVGGVPPAAIAAVPVPKLK